MIDQDGCWRELHGNHTLVEGIGCRHFGHYTSRVLHECGCQIEITNFWKNMKSGFDIYKDNKCIQIYISDQGKVVRKLRKQEID